MIKFFLISVLFLITSIFTIAYAVHPLPDEHSFDNRIITWCYDDSLRDLTLDGEDGRFNPVVVDLETTMQRISDNSNLEFIIEECDVRGNGYYADVETDPDTLGVTRTVFDSQTNQIIRKTVSFNTQHAWITDIDACTSTAPFVLSITNEHELGHVAGLGHFTEIDPNTGLLRDNYPSQDTIMNEEYFCTSTVLTPEDLNQINALYPLTEPPTEIVIPSWIKFNADWWALGHIADQQFIDVIQWLTENAIIQLGEVTTSETPSDDPIPDWIKNNARWWADGLITDETFATGLKWLVENGIIILDTPIAPASTASVKFIPNSLEIQRDDDDDNTITMADNAEDPTCAPDCFTPSVVNVGIGDTVTFVNSKSSPTVIASGNPETGTDNYFTSGPLGSGLSYSTTFSEAGIYNYFDLVSPWMQGTINVGGVVNQLPTSDAGSNQSVDEDSIVILSGSGSDPENGLLTYTWRQISGTTVSLSGSSFPGGVSNEQLTSFVAPDVATSETLTFELKVKDDVAQFDTDTVSVTVNNVSETTNNQPTANAGTDQTVNENTLVTLDGSASNDPDGDTITYLWEQTQGADVSFDSMTVNPTFTAPSVEGLINMQFKLIVTDDSGAKSFPDFVTISVNNVIAPTENIAPVAVNDLFQILGTDSVDFDILFNDYDDNDGDSISINSVDYAGTAGTVTNNGDDVTFDATEGFSGTTTFLYTITDGTLTDTGIVTVDVIDDSGGGDSLLYVPNPDVTVDGKLGTQVMQIDDSNGDGIADILASAPGNSGNTKLGTVYVIDGNVENSNGGNVITQIPSPNGIDDDGFGFAIDSVDSDTVIVGASRYDKSDTEFDHGAVYLFDSNGVEKSLVSPISPDTLLPFDYFGTSVVAYSNKIAVGAPGYDITELTSSASSKTFGLSSSVPIKNFVIAIDESGKSAVLQDRFSDEQVLISNVIVYNEFNPLKEETIPSNVPAFALNSQSIDISDSVSLKSFGTFPFDNSNLLLLVDDSAETSYLFETKKSNLLATTHSSAGAVFVFDGTTGNLAFSVIENPRPAGGDDFGESLSAIDGNIIVGVPDDDTNGTDSGSVYLLDGNDGSEIHYIPNPTVGSASSDDFGTSVGATDNYILVGAPDDDNDSGSNAGAAWVIDPVTGDDVHYLPNPRDVRGDDMGNAIAGTSDKIIVGEGDDGYVHVFDVDTGIHLITIENPDLPSKDDGFGDAVGALGENILIGAPNDASFFSGSVSVYSGDLAVVNNPPVAVDDADVIAINNTPIIIDVLENDSDPDGHSLTIDSVNFANTRGTVTNNGDDVTFFAELNFDGTTTFSYKASDGNGGLSNTATVSVTVSDSMAPVITLVGDNPQIIEVGEGFLELGYVVNDGTSPITVDTSDFADAVGSYSIFYDSTDVNGNVADTVTRIVNVVDTTSLTITAPADQSFEATSILTPLFQSDYGTATATDDNDPNPVITHDAPATFPLGDTVITWSATNSFDNTATDTQVVTVSDTVDPVIVLSGDNPQSINLGDVYVELGAISHDNIDGDVSANIVIDASAVNVNLKGSYPVTYNVVDSSGNSPITEFRNVIVTSNSPDVMAPIISLDGPNPQVIHIGNEPTIYSGIVTDDDPNYSGEISFDYGIIDDNTLGEYVVTYTAPPDDAGNLPNPISRNVIIASSENLIQNHSFESPTVPRSWMNFDGAVPNIGWDISWNQNNPHMTNPDYICPTSANLEIQNGILGGAAHGAQHAELDSNCKAKKKTPSSITQSITTEPGESYDVSFASKKRPGTADVSNALQVTANGVILGTLNEMTNSWQTTTFTFIADSDTTEISFSDMGKPDGLGTFLDDVTVRKTGDINSNLINNGSFEDVVVSDHGGSWQTFDSSQIDSWQITWNQNNSHISGNNYLCPSDGKIEIQKGILGGAYSGNNHAELDSHCNARFQTSVIISQDVITTPDVEYELSWYEKARPLTTYETNGLDVFVNDDLVKQIISMSRDWNQLTYTFVADSDETMISFADIGIPNTYGTFVDDIRLILVERN